MRAKTFLSVVATSVAEEGLDFPVSFDVLLPRPI